MKAKGELAAIVLIASTISAVTAFFLVSPGPDERFLQHPPSAGGPEAGRAKSAGSGAKLPRGEIVPLLDEERGELLFLPGDTAFQRRLVAGDLFLQLRERIEDPGANLNSLRDRFDGLRRHLLRSDPRTGPAGYGAPLARLSGLCEGFGLCSRRSLKLANPAAPGDRMGYNVRIRIWP